MSTAQEIQTLLSTSATGAKEMIQHCPYYETYIQSILTVPKLKKIAKNLNIPNYSTKKKSDIVNDIMKILDDEKKKQFKQCPCLSPSNGILERCENLTRHINNYCVHHRKSRYRLEKPDECPICMDTISIENECPLECGHWVHKECLKPTNLHQCPVCRQRMSNEDVQYVFGISHIERNHYADNYYQNFIPSEYDLEPGHPDQSGNIEEYMQEQPGNFEQYMRDSGDYIEENPYYYIEPINDDQQFDFPDVYTEHYVENIENELENQIFDTSLFSNIPFAYRFISNENDEEYASFVRLTVIRNMDIEHEFGDHDQSIVNDTVERILSTTYDKLCSKILFNISRHNQDGIYERDVTIIQNYLRSKIVAYRHIYGTALRRVM